MCPPEIMWRENYNCTRIDPWGTHGSTMTSSAKVTKNTWFEKNMLHKKSKYCWQKPDKELVKNLTTFHCTVSRQQAPCSQLSLELLDIKGKFAIAQQDKRNIFTIIRVTSDVYGFPLQNQEGNMASSQSVNISYCTALWGTRLSSRTS